MNFSTVTNFMNTLSDIGIPGADLAIYLKGEEVYRYHTGFADLDAKIPIASDTLYPIYSMTKVVTCVAALRLYEEGCFQLTDPISDYLPEFKAMNVQHTHENGQSFIEPAKNQIRIVDLFTMSSGISYEMTPHLKKLDKETSGNCTMKEFATAISKDSLYFEPGTHFRYGFSHDILAYLIEVLSGKTLGEYFYDHIFAPLGMKDTFFRVPSNKQSRFVTCYTYDEKEKKHEKIDGLPLGFLDPDFKYESGGGGLVSTVDDYAKFANTLCGGGTAANKYRLLHKATVDLMRTNHLDDVKLREFNTSEYIDYGYGLGVRTMSKPTDGDNNKFEGFGWSGLAGTFVRMDPSIELTFVYAQQMMPSKEECIYYRLRDLIYGCL